MSDDIEARIELLGEFKEAITAYHAHRQHALSRYCSAAYVGAQLDSLAPPKLFISPMGEC
jgi:hypothetical protein